MQIEIKHRWSNAVLFVGEFADMRGAVLAALSKEADLRGADLGDANLRGANLRGADLRGANLTGADLTGANLRDADLRDADLTNADLTNADLTNADLGDADLGDADLRGADLGDADLRGANLTGADLTGVQKRHGITPDPTLPARIVAQIEAHPETWDQETWHSACGTKHCVAGHAIVQSGPAGLVLEAWLGTSTAATLLLWRPGAVLPSFSSQAIEAETLGRLRAMAATADCREQIR